MIAKASDFYRLIKSKFPFQPTEKQDIVLLQLSDFIFETKSNELYLLKGFAGTGKTSIIGTIVSNLWQAKINAVLLAPTGRAAKVISNYSKKEAFTIHRKIYFPKKDKGGGVKFVMQPNKHRNTIFIVDEASMIPDVPAESKFFENGSLLDDLVQYVYETTFYDSFKFNVKPFKDIVRLVDGHDIMDAINDSYSNQGYEETAIIVRSNKRANLYNQQIRNRILFNEAELSAGDYLMVVKNNYFWIKPNTEAGFIANGDIIEVLEIFNIKELYGFKFAEVKIKMVDYPRMKPFETVLLLDTISVESASLTYEESNRLYQEVMKDYANESSNYKKFLGVKNNKFFNALQVKFSYAITCHKSQGGQWNTIFVEQPYLPEGPDKDYIRWLYTAITRAKEKLYLIGFKDDFFIED